MKSSSVLLIVLLLLTEMISAEVLIKPNDSNINYYGRFDFSSSSTVAKFNWPGSIIEAGFTGPSIGVELNDGGINYFNVEIDGVLVDSLKPSTVTHRTIRTNLSATTNHTIRITLRTNGSVPCSFGGFYLADGKTLTPKPAQPSRKMEIIGDSWTAGEAVGWTQGSSWDLKFYNATLTYGRMTSRAFHAEDKIIARGGCGMAKSLSGDAVMPVRYTEIVCDGTAKWDFASWIPDVVVIFLGINDYNSGATETDFKTAYKSFIDTVRSRYKNPNLPIVLANCADRVPANIPALAQSFTKVYTFTIPFLYNQARTMYQHPDVSQERQMADALIPVVKQATGWDTMSPVAIRGPKPTSENHYFASGIIKTSLDKIVFQPELSGISKAIVVYDCSGRPVRKLVTRKQTVSLKRDFGLAEGMFIVKVVQ